MNARGAGIALGVIFVALLAVPVIARRDTPVPPRDAASVIIITPHPEQIRNEFGDGFARWHQARFGTPATVINLLNREIVAALKTDTRDKIAGLGVELAPSSPKEFTDYMRAEIAKWSKIIKVAGISE